MGRSVDKWIGESGDIHSSGRVYDGRRCVRLVLIIAHHVVGTLRSGFDTKHSHGRDWSNSVVRSRCVRRTINRGGGA